MFPSTGEARGNEYENLKSTKVDLKIKFEMIDRNRFVLCKQITKFTSYKQIHHNLSELSWLFKTKYAKSK